MEEESALSAGDQKETATADYQALQKLETAESKHEFAITTALGVVSRYPRLPSKATSQHTRYGDLCSIMSRISSNSNLGFFLPLHAVIIKTSYKLYSDTIAD